MGSRKWEKQPGPCWACWARGQVAALIGVLKPFAARLTDEGRRGGAAAGQGQPRPDAGPALSYPEPPGPPRVSWLSARREGYGEQDARHSIRALGPHPRGGSPQAGLPDTPPGGMMLCGCALGVTPRPRDSRLPQVRGRRTSLHRAAPSQQFGSSLPKMITKAARERGDRGGLGTGWSPGEERQGSVVVKDTATGAGEIGILVLPPPLPSCVSLASCFTSLSLLPAL